MADDEEIQDDKDRRDKNETYDENPLKVDIDNTLYALIPQAEDGDILAMQKLIALADLRGNSRVIMPVLLLMNADIERTLGHRSPEIDEFIIGFCLSSIGYMRYGRKELLSSLGGEAVPTSAFEEKKSGRGLLSRIFGR